MRLTLLFTSVLFLLTASGFSQVRSDEKKEQIKALKVAFLTDELQLTASEAEKFWPLFNAYESRQTELRQQKMKSLLRRLGQSTIDKMSDKEATSLLNEMENTEQDIFENRKKFIAGLRLVLSPVKILKLKKAEEDFNRKLLRQYRGKSKK